MTEYESFPVWYFEDAMCNIMSLSLISKKYFVKFDSYDRGGVFKIHANHYVIEFLKHGKGLYCLDLAPIHESDGLCNTVNEQTFMIETIHQNYEGFTKKEIDKLMLFATFRGCWEPKSSRL